MPRRPVPRPSACSRFEPSINSRSVPTSGSWWSRGSASWRLDGDPDGAVGTDRDGGRTAANGDRRERPAGRRDRRGQRAVGPSATQTVSAPAVRSRWIPSNGDDRSGSRRIVSGQPASAVRTEPDRTVGDVDRAVVRAVALRAATAGRLDAIDAGRAAAPIEFASQTRASAGVDRTVPVRRAPCQSRLGLDRRMVDRAGSGRDDLATAGPSAHAESVRDPMARPGRNSAIAADAGDRVPSGRVPVPSRQCPRRQDPVASVGRSDRDPIDCEGPIRCAAQSRGATTGWPGRVKRPSRSGIRPCRRGAACSPVTGSIRVAVWSSRLATHRPPIARAPMAPVAGPPGRPPRRSCGPGRSGRRRPWSRPAGSRQSAGRFSA